MPSAYGSWKTIYTRFSRWSDSGVLARLLEALAREHDAEGFLVDATIVRALGNPVRVILPPGQRNDIKLADKLLEGVHDAYVAADRAYDAKALVQMLEASRCTVVIPSHPTRAVQREIDLHLYKERHLVECFFQRLKRFRRIPMRFEKLARNFLTFVYLACVLIGLA